MESVTKRLESIEKQLEITMNMLELITEQNKILIENHNQTNQNMSDKIETIEEKITTTFDDIGGSDLKQVMEKLNDINFDSISYLTDVVANYRTGGMLSFVNTIKMIT